MENIPMYATAIGALAFVVSMIVQVIKGVGVFNNIPTNLVVLVLSIVLTVVTYLAYASYVGIALVWYYITATVVVGFMVAFIAMYGWEKLTELWTRFKAPT